MIRPPHPHEIKLLPQIENAADLRYRRAGLDLVVRMPCHSLAVLECGRRNRLLWVAASPTGRPVGFALMDIQGEIAMLDQLSVLDRWQRNGLGSALIARCRTEARARGHALLHLTTYRDVAWNKPYYERRGFHELPRGSFNRALRGEFSIGVRHGHPVWRRAVMVQPT